MKRSPVIYLFDSARQAALIGDERHLVDEGDARVAQLADHVNQHLSRRCVHTHHDYCSNLHIVTLGIFAACIENVNPP